MARRARHRAASRASGNHRWWLGAIATASLLTGAGPSRADGEAEAQVAAAVDTAAPTATAPFPNTLSGQIDAALAQPFLATGQVGVVAFDLETGHMLYQRGAELPLNPASNMKLVTTATALGVLGPAHRFSTRLYHDKDALQGSTIEGNVYLRGSGDPALVTEDLLRMAADLRARGIRRITGGIVIDATRFDRDELPPGFDQKEELAAYRAPSGAASVNFNTFELRVRPGQAADATPYAAVDPPVPHLELVNDAKTGPGHLDRLSVALEVEKKRTRITLRGTIGVDAGSQGYRYPVDAPSTYAGEVLAYALRQNGVKLGQARIRRDAVPGDASLLAVHHSEPLSVLIRAVNKHSNNFMAEQILKGLASAGAPATFADALTRVREHLADLGIETQGLRLGNGSGLYDTNRVTAGTLVALLSAVYRDFRISSDFLASLAIMGVDGTTRSRLETSDRRGFVRAKTGTLDGVYCLSGYAGAPGRAPIAFSILFNGLRKADAGNARATHNRIAELLARHAAGVPLVVEAPVTTPGATAAETPESASEGQ